MNNFKADLHCHSTCSDGSFSPEELVRHAVQIGLSGLSITDHDTIAAYDTIFPLSEKLGLKIIPGVEFSSSWRDITVHILAYSFSLESDPIRTHCLLHEERRRKRVLLMLKLLEKQGIKIDEQALNAIPHSIGRPHLAYLMLQKGYVKSIQEAFDRFLGDGRCCFVSGNMFDVHETLEVIRQANGIAILAHPHLIRSQLVLLDLLKMPFDGLEGYYASFSQNQHERWLKIAQNKGWLVTGGSDFHGAHKMTPLGASWVSEEVFSILEQRYLENKK